jgi:4-phytase/acid phosphatase
MSTQASRNNATGYPLRQQQAGAGAASHRSGLLFLEFWDIMMTTRTRISFRQLIVCLLLIPLARPALAVPVKHARHLAFVLILTRHGVRAPGDSPARLQRFSVDSWPKWPVQADYLTDHGYKLLVQFGGWDRNWLIHAGLLSSGRCNARDLYIYTDSDERTIRSGDALAKGLSSSCAIEVHSLPQGTHDPLFHFSPSSLDAATQASVLVAVRKKLGGSMEAFTAKYGDQLDLLQSVLDGCKPGTCCPKKGERPSIEVKDLPSRVKIEHSHDIVSVKGPVFTAASLAEDMLLEYTQGLPQKEVAWGLLNESQLREIIGLHTAEFSVRHRIPALAGIQMSNLLDHLLLTLKQAVQGSAVQGAFGPVGTKTVIVDGHDTDIAAIAGLLHLHWMLDGRKDDTPPGTQLQFLVYRDRRGQASIQIRIVMQTLNQMRFAMPLTGSNPPASAILNPPNCKLKRDTCSWASFQETVTRSIDPRFVVPLKQ